MNPFSKRIHQIKNPDLDLPKGTRNPFLDLKSVFGFTERNTPLDSGFRILDSGFNAVDSGVFVSGTDKVSLKFLKQITLENENELAEIREVFSKN